MKRIAVSIQKAIHWAYNNALGLVEIPLAFVAFSGVYNKILIAWRYRLGRAHRFTKAAIDTGIGNG
jgi:hypothetical protein